MTLDISQNHSGKNLTAPGVAEALPTEKEVNDARGLEVPEKAILNRFVKYERKALEMKDTNPQEYAERMTLLERQRGEYNALKAKYFEQKSGIAKNAASESRESPEKIEYERKEIYDKKTGYTVLALVPKLNFSGRLHIYFCGDGARVNSPQPRSVFEKFKNKNFDGMAIIAGGPAIKGAAKYKELAHGEFPNLYASIKGAVGNIQSVEISGFSQGGRAVQHAMDSGLNGVPVDQISLFDGSYGWMKPEVLGRFVEEKHGRLNIAFRPGTHTEGPARAAIRVLGLTENPKGVYTNSKGTVRIYEARNAKGKVLSHGGVPLQYAEAFFASGPTTAIARADGLSGNIPGGPPETSPPRMPPPGKRLAGSEPPERPREPTPEEKQFQESLKKYIDSLAGISKEEKDKMYSTMDGYTIPLFEKQFGCSWMEKTQQQDKYAKLASLYLETHGNSFRVSDGLNDNHEIKMGIGAGHLLPPHFLEVSIADGAGKTRTGTREVRGGRVGYFDAKGYIPIFGGYQITPTKIIDPLSKEAIALADAEKALYDAKKAEYREIRNEEKSDDLFSTMEGLMTATPESMKAQNYDAERMKLVLDAQKKVPIVEAILKYNRIDLNEDSSRGARAFYNLNLADLGWKEGAVLTDPAALKASSESPVIKLLKTLQNGGDIAGVPIDGGYSLKYTQFPEIIYYAKNPEKLNQLAGELNKISPEKNVTAHELILAIFQSQGKSFKLAEVQEYVSKNPQLSYLLDPRWGLARYMQRKGLGMPIAELEPPTDAMLNAGSGQLAVGDKRCAYTVSQYLGLKESRYGLEWNAPNMMVRMLRGGGEVVANWGALQRLDTIYMRKNRPGPGESNMVGHVMLCRDTASMKNGGKIVIVQDDAKILGVDFMAINPSDKPRLQQVLRSAIAARGNTSRMQAILEQEFSPADALKFGQAIEYRKNFSQTLTVSTVTDSYNRKFYVGVRPRYTQNPNAVVRSESVNVGSVKRVI
ncbi:MAG: hypothetical protein AAB551_03340 [Patescibacteria group bacterium]